MVGMRVGVNCKTKLQFAIVNTVCNKKESCMKIKQVILSLNKGIFIKSNQ